MDLHWDTSVGETLVYGGGEWGQSWFKKNLKLLFLSLSL